MKSLNLRFADANVKAMNDLVRAGFYGSIADVVRAAVRDLLMREY
jgi:Arc/MetJ-type ribon-helix-helix transcriptional regulator